MSKAKKTASLPVLPTVEETTRIAWPPKRYFAFLIDYFTIMMTLVALYPLFLPQEWDMLEYSQVLQHLIPLYLIGLLLLFSKDAVRGKSIGKAFFNLRVVRVDQALSLPDQTSLFKRNLWLLLLPVEAVKMLTDPYCRRFGDRQVNCCVVEDIRPPQVRALTTKVVGAMLVLASLWLGYILLAPVAIKKTKGYQLAYQAALADQEVSQALGKIESVSYWPNASFEGDRVFYQLRVETAKEKERLIQVVLEKREGQAPQLLKVMLLDPVAQ